jgi:hypothetical protein
MFQDSPAEIIPFERFLESRRRLFGAVPPPETLEPPVSTDPGNSARREKEPRTMRTMAVARRFPERTTL